MTATNNTLAAPTPTRDAPDQPGHDGRYALVDIATITPDPDNQRRAVDAAFIRSVRAHGILEPILITPANADAPDGTYVLVAGERRWTAAAQAGLSVIPAIIRPFTAPERIVVQAVENLQRADLAISQQAVQAARALAVNMTKKDLAAKLGRSSAWLSARLRVLDTPKALWRYIDAETIPLDALPAIIELSVDRDLVTALAAELRDGLHGNALERRIDTLRRERSRQHKIAELVEAANHAGQRITAWHGEHPPKGAGYATVASLGLTGSAATNHGSEPCAAIAIRADSWSDNVTPVHVCTDPARHATRGTSTVKTPTGTGRTAADERRLEHDRRRKHSHSERDAFMLGALTKMKNPDALTIVSHALLDHCDAETAKAVGRLLALEATKSPYGTDDWRGPLAAHAATTAKHATHVAVLIAYARSGSRYPHRSTASRVRHWMLANGWAPAHPEDSLAADPQTDHASDDGDSDDQSEAQLGDADHDDDMIAAAT